MQQSIELLATAATQTPMSWTEITKDTSSNNEISTAAMQLTTMLNTSWMTTSNATQSPSSYTKLEAIVMSLIFFPASMFGFISNVITIYVLWRPSMLNTVFNYFIISLAMSDVISSLTVPLLLYRLLWGHRQWEISEFLCQVYCGVDFGTSVLTSLHILIFSILRFASMKWPHQFCYFTIKLAKMVIFLLWMIAFTCGALPHGMWCEVRPSTTYGSLARPSCGIHGKNKTARFSKYITYGYSIFFFIPCVLVVVVCCGSSLLLIVRHRKRVKKNNLNNGRISEGEAKRQKKENFATTQLLLIAGSFLLGYLPFSAYYLFLIFAKRSASFLTIVQWFGRAAFVCLRISECLNPLFYNLASSKIRAETKKCLKKMFCLSTQQNQNVSASNGQSMLRRETRNTHT